MMKLGHFFMAGSEVFSLLHPEILPFEICMLGAFGMACARLLDTLAARQEQIWEEALDRLYQHH